MDYLKSFECPAASWEELGHLQRFVRVHVTYVDRRHIFVPAGPDVVICVCALGHTIIIRILSVLMCGSTKYVLCSVHICIYSSIEASCSSTLAIVAAVFGSWHLRPESRLQSSDWLSCCFEPNKKPSISKTDGICWQ